MARYTHDYAAFNAEVLNAEFMVAHMHRLAETVKATAEATAPDAPPYGEGYRSSFVVESGKHGGIRKDRAYGRVTSTDPAALSIEFGTAKTPAHLTLTRALDSIRGKS